MNANIKQHDAPSITTLYDLPLEMLDDIFKKSCLYWILNSSTKQRDEDVIRSLISVDVYFNKIITRQRFKKTIWRYMKDYYGKTKKRHAIIRNNRNYLENNIQPNDELLASLLSLNCITDEQSHFIQRQRSKQEKNNKLLYVVESFDEKKFSTFVNCLRHTNQRTVTKVIENGGGVIKMQLQTCDAKLTASVERQQTFYKNINDLRNRTKSRSHEADKLIVQLRDEDLEILSSQLIGQTVVVWIWCHSQRAIGNLKELYESNQLRDKYFEKIQPSTSKVINIDSNQFKKTVVVLQISIKVTQQIDISDTAFVRGVIKLRNEIYVLSYSHSRIPFTILVFEDRYPFRLQKNIEVEEIKHARDIGSSEKKNCLYVSDPKEKCVWKITRETDEKHKIIKWLTTDYEPWTMSVSRDGEFLMINHSSHHLMIYGSDAELIQVIPIPRDIKGPLHAVETSIGNFIIVHRHNDDVEEEKMKVMKGYGINSIISEFTRDGQMIIRRFIASEETQQLINCDYLSLDSDDRVFVTDTKNNRVILLDSDLKWNRILCATTEEKKERILRSPWRLFYDEEMKQLIVGGLLGPANVYNLSRN